MDGARAGCATKPLTTGTRAFFCEDRNVLKEQRFVLYWYDRPLAISLDVSGTKSAEAPDDLMAIANSLKIRVRAFAAVYSNTPRITAAGQVMVSTMNESLA